MSRIRDAWDTLLGRAPVEEAKQQAMPARGGNPSVPERIGYVAGVDPRGVDEYSSAGAAGDATDRRSQMQALYDAYRMCTWSWVSVNAIARTITAGGLQSDWDSDDGDGDQEQPDKPANVVALERLLDFVNPNQDLRQLLRATIVDLLVFGDAFWEVTWLGGQPVALYNLDAANTTPITDEHGTVSRYVQLTEFGQRAEFEPNEVIHFRYDAPRGGVFGLSPTDAATLPITIWLFTAATLKETFRKGNPRDVHVDHPKDLSNTESNKWLNQYMVRNIGPRNIGRPLMTKGGATVKELSQSRIAEMLATLEAMRDQILADYGVPPAEAGVIESGNLGGGTGESQRKTFRVNTCGPIAEMILEKVNFELGVKGFGIEGWHQKFGEIDMRDSKVIEDIRDLRIRSGLYTLNKGRAEIGEPPVDGGDTPVLIDRQNIVLWRDLVAYSKAGIASKLKGTALEPDEPGDEKTPVTLIKPAPAPVPEVLKPFAGKDNPPPDGEDPTADDQQTPPAGNAAGKPAAGKTPPAADKEPKEETSRARNHRDEYRRRLAEALRDAGIPAA